MIFLPNLPNDAQNSVIKEISLPEWKIGLYSTSSKREGGISPVMSTHLSKSQLERFAVGALEDDELVSAATHTADCESCDKAFVEELRTHDGSGPFAFTLNPEFWFRHDHLQFEDLVGVADETVDDELKEIFDIHLKTCSRCSEDLTSFLAYRKLENASAGP